MFRRVALLVALIAGLAPVAAEAADYGNPFLARVVGRLHRRGESFACFSRRYDDAHLAGHPTQKVTFGKALVSTRFVEPWAPFGYRGYMYSVSLAFEFRDRPETLTTVAECGDGKPKDSLRGGAVCAIVGGTTAHLTMDGKDTLVMEVPGGVDLWAPGPKEQRHDTVENPFGPDDRVFRLVRTELRRCEDLAFDRQIPLRQHEP